MNPKRTLFSVLCCLALLCACMLVPAHTIYGQEDAAAATDALCTSVSDVPNVKIYRLYCSANGEHLYTTDYNEVKTLTSKHGWRDEGIAWYAPRTGVPVYRLYNKALQNHLYTTDVNEVNVLTSLHGWTKDFSGKPLFYSGGSVNVYRLYNKALRGLHLWTTDTNEYRVLPSHGWKQEGVSLKGTSKTFTQSYPIGSSDISNVASQYAIQADVKLSGSGTGYHAKLVACTATSAVSFGIQYDRYSAAPYTDATTFLIENVASNNAGQQVYTRTGYSAKNETFRLLLAVQKNGSCDVYVNGNKVGSVTNSGLANNKVYLRVEGSGRKNGDSVNASFSNIQVKGSGVYNPSKTWGTHNFDTNPGIHSQDAYAASRQVTISGTVTGLTQNQDWDNAYGIVSGILQFVE